MTFCRCGRSWRRPRPAGRPTSWRPTLRLDPASCSPGRSAAGPGGRRRAASRDRRRGGARCWPRWRASSRWRSWSTTRTGPSRRCWTLRAGAGERLRRRAGAAGLRRPARAAGRAPRLARRAPARRAAALGPLSLSRERGAPAGAARRRADPATRAGWPSGRRQPAVPGAARGVRRRSTARPRRLPPALQPLLAARLDGLDADRAAGAGLRRRRGRDVRARRGARARRRDAARRAGGGGRRAGAPRPAGAAPSAARCASATR